jgi:hypothetical protein
MAGAWVDFPLYTISFEEEEFVLPNQRDIKNLQEKVLALKESFESYSGDDKNIIEAKKFAYESQAKFLEDLKNKNQDYHKTAQLHLFQVRSASYGEWLEAEERARDFIIDRFEVNEQKFYFYLACGRVKKDGKILGEAELKAIENPMIGRALIEEVKILSSPNPLRIPLLKASS